MNPTILNNRYRLIRELGDGGFGRTYLVEDTHMPSGRRCVIKQLKPITNNPQIYELVQARFQREAAILEELGEGSTQIPKLYGYFSEQGQFYLVQEWIEGQTLTTKVQQEGPLSESSVREILKSILPVLEYVHSKRLIHRDIKPDNIILRNWDHKPVLIDFGAVRETMSTVVNSQGNATHSIVIGSPGFMPSEQAVGRPVYSSDLYSLGLTAIYLLTGKLPQELETNYQNGEIIWQPYALSVSPSLATVLDRAIKSQPQDRYSSAREMLDALSHASNTFPATEPYYQNPPQATQRGEYSSAPPTVINPPYPQPSQAPYPLSSQAPNYQYQYQSDMVGGGGTFNTSVPVPPEIRGWNWGAFLLPGFWCFNTQVWIGLLAWVLYVNLPMHFILGAKGNEWAWRSRQWRSVQDFKANQRAWARAGIIVDGSVFALMFLAIVIAGLSGTNTSSTSNIGGNSTPSNSSSNTSPSPSPAAPSPSEAPPSPSPAASSGSAKFKQVYIGSLQSYTYNKELFSISVPNNWIRKEKSDSSQVFVEWIDNTDNGLIYIKMIKGEGTRTLEQLGTQLQTFLNNAYKSEPDFQMGSPAAQPDQTSKVNWSFTATGDNGTKGTLQGSSYILQIGDKVAIVTFAAPQQQFSGLEPEFSKIFSTFKITRSVPLPF